MTNLLGYLAITYLGIAIVVSVTYMMWDMLFNWPGRDK